MHQKSSHPETHADLHLRHLEQDGPDVARTQVGEIDAADEGDDLPADEALVRLKRPSPRPSDPLVLEPSAQVRGQLDPLGTGVAAGFEVADVLVPCALRLSLGGEPATC